jgi:hypothetical protein
MKAPPDTPADLTDYLLERDLELRRLSRRIRRQHGQLKQLIGLEHFRFYLLLEDTTAERCFVLADRMWKMGRAQGRREGPRCARARTETRVQR